MTISPAERARRAQLAGATRTAAVANTRPTTRPGSETTTLTVGDPVTAHRDTPRSGTWAAYDGRNGWVATVNTQRLPNGRQYVEIGVCWARPKDMEKASAEVWFRADELERRP